MNDEFVDEIINEVKEENAQPRKISVQDLIIFKSSIRQAKSKLSQLNMDLSTKNIIFDENCSAIAIEELKNSQTEIFVNIIRAINKLRTVDIVNGEFPLNDIKILLEICEDIPICISKNLSTALYMNTAAMTNHLDEIRLQRLAFTRNHNEMGYSLDSKINHVEESLRFYSKTDNIETVECLLREKKELTDRKEVLDKSLESYLKKSSEYDDHLQKKYNEHLKSLLDLVTTRFSILYL